MPRAPRKGMPYPAGPPSTSSDRCAMSLVAQRPPSRGWPGRGPDDAAGRPGSLGALGGRARRAARRGCHPVRLEQDRVGDHGACGPPGDCRNRKKPRCAHGPLWRFLQIVESYQLDTPIGSLSLGLVALLLLLVHPENRFGARFAQSGALRVGIVILGCWCLSSLLRTSYEPATAALRGALTTASFILVVVVAAGFSIAKRYFAPPR